MTNGRRQLPPGSVGGGSLLRNWSRVWSWPIPAGTYVDPEEVRRFVEEEADRGVVIDPEEVRAYTTCAASLRAAGELGTPVSPVRV